MKRPNNYQIEYFCGEYEQAERQKRLDDAFDVIFEEIESDEMGRTNNKNEYEHSIVIKR